MRRHPLKWIVAGAVAISATIAAAPATATASPWPADNSRYEATIVRTALASDNLCTMTQTYVTVQGDGSRDFGPHATAPGPGGGEIPNVLSDIYWRSVIASKVIPRLLAVRTGVSAVSPQVRQLMTGYVAGCACTRCS